MSAAYQLSQTRCPWSRDHTEHRQGFITGLRARWTVTFWSGLEFMQTRRRYTQRLGFQIWCARLLRPACRPR